MEVQKLFFEAVKYNNGSQRSSTRDMPELLLLGDYLPALMANSSCRSTVDKWLAVLEHMIREAWSSSFLFINAPFSVNTSSSILMILLANISASLGFSSTLLLSCSLLSILPPCPPRPPNPFLRFLISCFDRETTAPPGLKREFNHWITSLPDSTWQKQNAESGEQIRYSTLQVWYYPTQKKVPVQLKVQSKEQHKIPTWWKFSVDCNAETGTLSVQPCNSFHTFYMLLRNRFQTLSLIFTLGFPHLQVSF